MPESRTLQYARRYVARGFNVIPLAPGSKIPPAGFPVMEHRDKLPTEEQLVAWFGDGTANIGVLTGDLVVLDDDSYGRATEMEQKVRALFREDYGTLTVKTPRGGTHHWFLHFDADIGNQTHLMERKLGGKTHVDVRGTGGHVVAPPSRFEGVEYKFLGRADILPLPPDLRSILLNGKGSYLHEEFTHLGKDKSYLQGSGLGGGVGGGVGVIANTGRARARGEEKRESEPPDASVTERDSERDRALQSVTSVTDPSVTERDNSVTGRDDGDFSQGNRDVALFYVAARLKEGGCKRSTADAVIRMLARQCVPPFQERLALAKVHSAYSRDLPGEERDLRAQITEWITSVAGTFNYADLDRDLDLRNAREKAHRRQVIKRLTETGVIERDGKRAGWFRLVNTLSPVIRWKDADTSNEWPIVYPFGIENHFITLPRNIVLIDGATDSGKTAFLMNVAYKNAVNFPGRIVYFSSEMAEIELKSRLEKFPNPSVFDDVIFEDRVSDFHDVVRPDDINIIDYLEIPDEFYKVGSMIRAIYERLRGGICIIARQKKAKEKSGRGGDFGKQLPRLVLLMDHGKLEIDKCKNWRDPMLNPRGKVFGFKLVQGWRFLDCEEKVTEEEDF